MVAKFFIKIIIISAFILSIAGCGEDTISGPDLDQNAECHSTCTMNADGSWTNSGFE